MRRRPADGLLTAEVVAPAVVLVAGVLYGQQAVQEGVGSTASTGAGFFPLLVAVVLVAASAVALALALRTRRHASVAPTADRVPAPGAGRVAATPDPDEVADEGEADEGDVSWPRVLSVLVASLAVPLLAETLGFVVTLSAVVAVIAKVMGMPGLLRPLLLGAVFGVTVWFVFVYWLFVPLPAGVLGLA